VGTCRAGSLLAAGATTPATPIPALPASAQRLPCDTARRQPPTGPHLRLRGQAPQAGLQQRLQPAQHALRRRQRDAARQRQRRLPPHGGAADELRVVAQQRHQVGQQRHALVGAEVAQRGPQRRRPQPQRQQRVQQRRGRRQALHGGAAARCHGALPRPRGQHLVSTRCRRCCCRHAARPRLAPGRHAAAWRRRRRLGRAALLSRGLTPRPAPRLPPRRCPLLLLLLLLRLLLLCLALRRRLGSFFGRCSSRCRRRLPLQPGLLRGWAAGRGEEHPQQRQELRRAQFVGGARPQQLLHNVKLAGSGRCRSQPRHLAEQAGVLLLQDCRHGAPALVLCIRGLEGSGGGRLVGKITTCRRG
jgi:hypothetical protein